MGFKETMLVALVTFSFILNSGGMVRGRRISREEDDELERQLKLLNKPAIKTIKTEEGQIFDCVDIYKQPAFDHPLLKNHTIQMKPSAFPRGMNRKNTSSNAISIEIKGLGCPQGSVPIRRIQKQDLLRMKSLPRRYGTNQNFLPDYQVAISKTKTGDNVKFYGGRSFMTVYTPFIIGDQLSAGFTWVQNGPLNSISVGWIVDRKLYGDTRTHLFGYWTADNSAGCFDLLCAGFVQLSSDTPLGLVLEPTSHDEVQYETEFLIFKDPKTDNWWLAITPNEMLVGYWPHYLFTSLRSHAEMVGWGGEVYSPKLEAAPPMGSGQFITWNYHKTCYARIVQYVNEFNQLVGVDRVEMENIADKPQCYNAKYDGYRGSGLENTILFGGPGGLGCTD